MLLPQGEDPDTLIRQEGLEIFSKRIISTQTLSDYFFDHLTKKLDLATLEGQSKLVSTAQSYLQQLPESVFKKMMFAHLQKISNLSMQQLTESVENSKKLATLKEHKYKIPKGKRGKPSLARLTIALLLQNPALADILTKKMSHWTEVEFPGLDVLKDVLRTIVKNKPSNMGALIECYRDTDKYKMINTLASYNLELDAASKEVIEKTFTDGINKLIYQAKDALLTDLLVKENSHSLNAEEKKILIKMLKLSTMTDISN
jgi:DNA primase